MHLFAWQRMVKYACMDMYVKDWAIWLHGWIKARKQVLQTLSAPSLHAAWFAGDVRAGGLAQLATGAGHQHRQATSQRSCPRWGGSTQHSVTPFRNGKVVVLCCFFKCTYLPYGCVPTLQTSSPAEQTFRTHTHAAATWPGLIDASIEAMELEKQARASGRTGRGGSTTKAAAPSDPFGNNAGKQLKKLLQSADNGQRSGAYNCCNTVDQKARRQSLCQLCTCVVIFRAFFFPSFYSLVHL
jgi:hypothetical protein